MTDIPTTSTSGGGAAPRPAAAAPPADLPEPLAVDGYRIERDRGGFLWVDGRPVGLSSDAGRADILRLEASARRDLAQATALLGALDLGVDLAALPQVPAIDIASRAGAA